MKASGIVALTLLSAAAAVPHRQHAHLHQNKRDMVWVTETDIVVETIYQTTTTYFNPGEAAPTSAPAATTEEPSSTEPSSTPEPTTLPSSTTPLTSSTTPLTSSTTPVATSSTPTSTYVAPTTLVPVVSSSAAPSSTYVAPSSTAVQSSAAPAASSASSSSDTSVSAADVHTAHLTYYSPDVGTSYCGPVYANTQPVVALASGQMSQSMCNKKIKISHGGKTVDAFIGDSCPGCPGTYGLDLSPSLFESLAALADGVIDGATWWMA